MVGLSNPSADRRLSEAARALFQSARSGDPNALCTLALWRVSGAEIRRELSVARELLRSAAERGHQAAALIHSYFVASGIGGASDPRAALKALRELAETIPVAARQLTLIEAMGESFTAPEARRENAVMLDADLPVVLFPGFLSPAEAQWLQIAAKERLAPSVIVDPATGRQVPNPIRRSDEAFFGVLHEDLVVNAINRRIAAVADKPAGNGEPLLVLRYQPGGEYRAHSDTLAHVDNQRVATMLLYLNDDYQGGETEFPLAGVKHRGRSGDALFFSNVDNKGQPLRRALHAGLPVSRGEKWLATRWIRQRPYTFPDPKPALEI